VVAVLHKPTRGFGAKPDTAPENKGWDECGTELETPRDATCIFDDDIGSETQENSYRRGLVISSDELSLTSSPATTHSCQNITRAPRIRAGANSAEKMGTVAFFAPIPIPRTNLAANNCCHDCAKPDPIGQAVRQQAVRKISPLRPR
jgi:hypothetical protein